MTEENAVRIRVERYQRKACEDCGKPATYRFGFLLEGYRHNPASSAYGRDDCSRCSDLDVFKCEDCMGGQGWLRPPEGYMDASRVTYSEAAPHYFLDWVTVSGDEADKLLRDAVNEER